MAGLRDDFPTDLDTIFFEEEEFACNRDFEIIENGMAQQFTTRCVWDTETLKNRLIVVQQGVYLGSVLLFISTSWFSTEPKPEQIIRSRAVGNVVWEGWRVVDITDAESCYEIALDKLIA
jgi:hypothetical protein